jgi:hypothetical protein
VAERTGRGLADRELESALRDLGAHLAFPPTADLLPAVRSRIEERAGTGLLQIMWSPRFAALPALATVVVLLVAALALQPIGASAAEALGLRGLGIFRTATAPPAASGKAILSDARRIASVDQASGEAGFAVVLPAALGAPDEVYVRADPRSAQVFLVYGSRSGVEPSAQTGLSVLVTEIRATLETQLLGKVAGPGTKVEPVTVNGGPGVWIEGAPHQIFVRAPNGDVIVDTLRLAGNVLVWQQGSVLVRIEADITKNRALEVAASAR